MSLVCTLNLQGKVYLQRCKCQRRSLKRRSRSCLATLRTDFGKIISGTTAREHLSRLRKPNQSERMPPPRAPHAPCRLSYSGSFSTRAIICARRNISPAAVGPDRKMPTNVEPVMSVFDARRRPPGGPRKGKYYSKRSKRYVSLTIYVYLVEAMSTTWWE